MVVSWGFSAAASLVVVQVVSLVDYLVALMGHSWACQKVALTEVLLVALRVDELDS